MALGASITISPTGGGTFAIQGNRLNGVSGIELTLGYDSSLLSSPSVSQGSFVAGALLSANTTIPGSIRISIVRLNPFFGSGQIAAVSFASQSNAGTITSATVRMIDTNGAILPSQASISGATPPVITGIATTPGTTSAPSTPQTPVMSQPASTTASTTTAILGTVTMPGETTPKSETKPTIRRFLKHWPTRSLPRNGWRCCWQK